MPSYAFLRFVLALMTAIRLEYGEAEAPWSATYETTADAIATRCQDARVDGGGADWCAALAVTMAFHESRFNPDASHDSGAGAGLFGTHAATLGRPVPQEQEGQVDAFLQLFHTSAKICAARPLGDRLGWYAAGGSGCERRLELSRFRMHQAARLLKSHPWTH